MHRVLRPNAPHSLLIQRFALLTVITCCAVFFSTRRMYFVCILLLPLLYLLSMSAYPENPSHCYETINDRERINAILDALPTPDQEPANWMSKMYSLVWPHVFSQERIDEFKASFQAAIDANPIPYFSSIQLVSLEIGDRAPQITQVTMPSKPQAASNSVLYQVSMLYYPEFKLQCLVTPKDVPAFNITLSDPTFDMEWFTQFEFCPKPYIGQIPFMTAVAFSLAKKPNLHRDFFKVTLFTSSNLFNRDSFKKHMSEQLADALWDIAGFPNGMIYDKVKATWRRGTVFGSKKMKRTSMSRGELLRYSRVKTAAKEFCKELRLPEPMSVKAISHKDQATSSYHLTLLNTLVEETTVENVKMVADEFSANAPSEGELQYFIELSYGFLVDKFTETSEMILQRQRKSPTTVGMTKRFEEEILAPVYVYLNFLNLQIKVNAAIAEQLELQKRVNKLEKMIMGFHNKMYKLTS